MDPGPAANGSLALQDVHPCYEANGGTYEFARRPAAACVLLYVFLGSLSVLTVCGNLLVVASVAYFRQLHTPTNYLILSLAVADLLVGVVVFPFSMAFTVTWCLRREDALCRVRDGFDATLCTSSILNLCCIAVDRYYAVCQPLSYGAKISPRVTLAMILLSWGASGLIGVGIIAAGFSQGACEGACSVDVAAANTAGPVFSFYLPAAVMLCIYLKVFLVAQRQANSVHNAHGGRAAAAAGRSERKATRTLATVMGVFLLCLSPYFLVVVLQPLAAESPPPHAIETLNWLTLSNSMLNPLIYAFFYGWFRSASRVLLSGKTLQADLADCRLF